MYEMYSCNLYVTLYIIIHMLCVLGFPQGLVKPVFSGCPVNIVYIVHVM